MSFPPTSPHQLTQYNIQASAGLLLGFFVCYRMSNLNTQLLGLFTNITYGIPRCKTVPEGVRADSTHLPTVHTRHIHHVYWDQYI